MSRRKAILDQINDIEATIVRIEAEAIDKTALAYRFTLQSLRNRQDKFREELEDNA